MEHLLDSAPEEAEPPLEHVAVCVPSPVMRRHGRGMRGVFPFSANSREFRDVWYPNVTDAQWNDWRWQLKSRLHSLQDFRRIFDLSQDEIVALGGLGTALPAAVTPYYASLLSTTDSSDPLRRTMIPTPAECHVMEYEANDPLHEDDDSPVPGLVHRYPDRVLFLATGMCAAYCRYCTRSRAVGGEKMSARPRKRFDAALAYIERTPQIRDVVVSGGDPFTLSDAALEYVLSRLFAIPHVEMVRLGTKAPMVMPQRITMSLVRILKRFHPLFVSIHATHPRELTPESSEALSRLADAGVVMGSQTVLLSGVNDNTATATALFRGLLRNRVRPYYLYQCDQVRGSSHFRTPLETGLDIIRGVRGHTSGYAVPHYVVDLPGGGGKTAVCPDAVVRREGQVITFRNYEGREFDIVNPMIADTASKDAS
ncbi:KamA family radical SAM protein [Desulfovibrio inopinatus]|uniref:KamA family radical SAM protein n=1 Tax=Desulfovibrio inopinatus TaxID=102109 RepID=UPI00040A3A59|nr:KamA family radical SAM protein [Desulfovibrio inopinatus]